MSDRQTTNAAVTAISSSVAQAATESCPQCAPTDGRKALNSSASASPSAASSAAEVGTAASVSASAPSQLAAATSAADDSSSPPSSSDKSTPLSAAPEPTATTTTATTLVADIAAGSAPAPTSSSCVAAAAAVDSFSSSSAVDVAAGLKKCSLCQRSLPESDYSGAQLKAKAKRQCKVCVAALQSTRARLPPSETLVVPQDVGARLAVIFTGLDNLLESEQIDGVRDLMGVLSECDAAGIRLHLDAAVIARVLTLLRDSQAEELRNEALYCAFLMAHQPPLIDALVAGGAISPALAFLGRAHLDQSHLVLCAAILRLIAEASHSNCAALLADGAMDALLPLVQPTMSVGLGEGLIPALAFLMRGQPAAEMAAAVAHLGALLMDTAALPELLCACLDAFRGALSSVATEQQKLDSWIESVLNAAPGVPRRLVELLDDRPDVADATLRLMIVMLKAKTDQLRLLFDCGLLDKLAPLLNNSSGKRARLLAACLYGNAASTKTYAHLLLASAPIIQPLLALLSTSENEMLLAAISFWAHVMRHRDRDLTRRMVNEYRALPPLVTAMRRVIGMADETAIFLHLGTIGCVLIVGDVEAEDDDRGINPYIEPLDWLGVFELVEPLQNSADAEAAESARFVYSYFIPNDCE